MGGTDEDSFEALLKRLVSFASPSIAKAVDNNIKCGSTEVENVLTTRNSELSPFLQWNVLRELNRESGRGCSRIVVTLDPLLAVQWHNVRRPSHNTTNQINFQ